MNNNLDWALRYQKVGLSPVPLNENEKHSFLRLSELKTLDKERINHYWNINPNYGIALRMDTIFSIDIDTPKHDGTTKIDGFNSLRENKKLLKILVEYPTLTAITPSDGVHLYYLKPKSFNLPANISGILKGVDIQAGKNNISVVPPTKMIQGSYKWVIPNAPIKEAPPVLINVLQELAGKNTTPNKFKNIPYRRYGWTGQLLDGLCKPVVVGKRNDYLTSIIGKLLSTGADPKTCYELANFTNNHFQEPLADKEVNRTFISIVEREAKRFEQRN